MKIEFVVIDGRAELRVDLTSIQEKLQEVDQALKQAQDKVKQIETATNELSNAARQWWATIVQVAGK